MDHPEIYIFIKNDLHLESLNCFSWEGSSTTCLLFYLGLKHRKITVRITLLWSHYRQTRLQKIWYFFGNRSLSSKTTDCTSFTKVSIDNFLLVEGLSLFEYFSPNTFHLKPEGSNPLKIADGEYFLENQTYSLRLLTESIGNQPMHNFLNPVCNLLLWLHQFPDIQCKWSERDILSYLGRYLFFFRFKIAKFFEHWSGKST